MSGDRSQVYHPSGISTRGGTIIDSHSAPSSSEANHYDTDDEQTIQGLVTRPTTNPTKFETYNITSTSNYIPISSFFDKFNSNSQATSLSLNLRVNKLIKNQKKMMKQKQELIKDINCWCNILPNDDCKKLLYHFIKILETELETNEMSIKKKEQINVQLLNVNKREKRTNDLKLKRNKMLIKLRDNENKIGDSPATTLTKENLEELECSVEIVEDQFIRSINNGLKTSIVEYVSALKEASGRYKENSDYFLENFYFATNKLSSSSNLQRIILQNKLNSAAPMSSASTNNNLSRTQSHEHFLDSKYVALSPSQVGKYLDNGFDTENYGIRSNAPEKSDAQQLRGEHLNQNTASDGSKPTNINHAEELLKGQHEYTQQLSAPPPTGLANKTVHNEIDANFIINSYSTPGALGMRPSSHIGNNNHEWT